MAEVLIIDDDKKMCEMITLIAESEGHRADESHSLSAGLQKVNT